MRRFLIISLYLLVTASLAGAVWWNALGTSLLVLDQKGRADLSLAADRLRLELQRSRDLAVLLSDDARATRGLVDPALGQVEPLVLQRFADRGGASDVLIVLPDGRVLASASGAEGQFAQAPWFRRALQGALGWGHLRERRAFAHGAPVFGADGQVAGAVAVIRDLAPLERSWRGDPLAIYFTDDAGRVFLSNREEFLRALPDQRLTPIRTFDVRQVEAGRYVPAEALHVSEAIPTLGLTAEMLLDTAPARASARSQALMVAAALLVLGAALVVLWERRRVLARANSTLEARVSERTEALTRANLRLTREVGERRDAEAALKQAQAELVQASKLSALGQMSAGISHELNQPLMAIGSFSQNAETFLQRGDSDAAGRNLAKIGLLAARMGRIIRNLRAFARAEPEPAVPTELAAVVDAALDITEARRLERGIETKVTRPERPVWALGGEVRLTQVLTNLIANAVDAMEGQDTRRLTITLQESPPRLTVADTGSGLQEPERLFDPFYSTKEVGQGLGLGLSISYGIVSSFGGQIRGRNLADGGAALDVELRPVAAEEETAA